MAVTRFAPSPTGYLHLGHAFSALFCRDAAGTDGRFLLRIDDIDQERCRPEFEAAIYEDLGWLGLDWERPVERQSDFLVEYDGVVARLRDRGVLYPCFCSRRDIRAEIARMASAPHGPDGPLYPGTCRGLSEAERRDRISAGAPYALRLDVMAAERLTGALEWHDLGAGRQRARPALMGDVVLARKEAMASYHLSVVVDDHRQGVTLVTRGLDLLPSTHVQRLLQSLLGYPTPAYHHHALLTDESGIRLAKRADSLAIRALRAGGMGPEAVRTLARSAPRIDTHL